MVFTVGNGHDRSLHSSFSVWMFFQSRFSIRKDYDSQNRDFNIKRKHCLLYPTFRHKTNTQLSLNPDFLSGENIIVRIGIFKPGNSSFTQIKLSDIKISSFTINPDFLSEKTMIVRIGKNLRPEMRRRGERPFALSSLSSIFIITKGAESAPFFVLCSYKTCSTGITKAFIPLIRFCAFFSFIFSTRVCIRGSSEETIIISFSPGHT